jgi:uncharacterized membrane protein
MTIMDEDVTVWKVLGLIYCGIWLLVSGWVAASFYAIVPEGDRFTEVRNTIAAGYILLGVGPVIGFAIWLKKQDHPLRWTQLIGLGICAIIPFIWVAYNGTMFS